MHRSRLSVLAIFAAAAACSTRADSDANAILSQDPSLVATLDVRGQADRHALPHACGALTSAAQPASASKAQAEELARKAYDAEVLGNTRDAQSLLRRASDLDGTDKSTAYHLGRASEALGDRAGAVTAYCRYLSLAPTTVESAEARQRLAKLSPSETRVAARSSVGSRLPTRGRVPAAAAGHGRWTSTVAGTVDDSPTDAATASREVDDRADRATAEGDVVASSRPLPTVDQPSTAPRTGNPGPGRVQSAGMGALGGAIIGAAIGRSVKSAVIGAAAGGILGTMVGGGLRPMNSGMRQWTTGVQQPAGYRSARLLNRIPAA